MKVPIQLTQGSVEGEILRLSAMLEEATEQLAKAMEEEASAEVDYRIAEARARLKSTAKSVEDRKCAALVECEAWYTCYVKAEAKREALAETCRTLRARLDALRTLSANLRGQT